MITSFAYTYDPNGNPTSIQTASGTESYRYDQRDRLVQACLDAPCQKRHALAYAYSYDPVGNMLSQQTSKGTTWYAYNAADELTSSRGPGPDATYSYDPNGNETRAGSTRYRYDLTNHIVSADGPGTFALYTYDGDGNMLTRRTHDAATQYQWDTNAALPQLAVEQTDHGNAIRTYGYGVGTTPTTLTSDGRNYYYLSDKLGSVVELTDTHGSSIADYRYDPYGNNLGEQGLQTGELPKATLDFNPIRYTGQYLDPTSGLYDLRARNYDAQAGRFNQPDPISRQASTPAASLYAYANENPATMVDPSGQKALLAAQEEATPRLNSKQLANARIIYTEGLKAALSGARSRELVAAAYMESTLYANARNPYSGAAGLFQLLSSGYVKRANQLGGVYNPKANTDAILPSYVGYWRRYATAVPGAAASAVEASGEPPSWYAKPLVWLPRKF